jgi:hypothetical protein
MMRMREHAGAVRAIRHRRLAHEAADAVLLVGAGAVLCGGTTRLLEVATTPETIAKLLAKPEAPTSASSSDRSAPPRVLERVSERPSEPEWTEATKWPESREVYGVLLARSERRHGRAPGPAQGGAGGEEG